MEISDATVWQVAAGDRKRSYQDVFLDWDVVCIGPGARGEWPKCKEQLIKDGFSLKGLNKIERLHNEMKEGDVVVLRIDTGKVYGVGRVVGDCCWNDHFGDIDGWDLQFVRRVVWLWDYRKDNDGKPKGFEAGEMRGVPRFYNLRKMDP